MPYGILLLLRLLKALIYFVENTDAFVHLFLSVFGRNGKSEASFILRYSRVGDNSCVEPLLLNSFTDLPQSQIISCHDRDDLRLGAPDVQSGFAQFFMHVMYVMPQLIP